MYDIKPLEEEWKKYRRNKLRPWYVGSFILIIFVATTILFLDNKNIDSSHLSTYMNTSIDTLMFSENKAEKEIENNVEVKIQNNVLVDGPLNILETQEVVAAVKEVDEKPSDILVDIPILEDGTELTTNETPDPRKRMHLDIVETSSPTAYEDVERRFLQSRDIDDALFLANSYYKKGNYKKAEYWALQTNKLDGDVEESLLIFVKSKIKLGYKNEGISILTSYIERSNSEEARKLLNQIKNGKF